MRNPFFYGGVVSGDNFCGRRKDLEILLRSISNREKVFLCSPRRFGKTSLILRAFERLQKEKYICVYADIFRTSCEEDFCRILTEAILNTLGKKYFSWSSRIASLFQGIGISFTTSRDGTPKFSVSWSPVAPRLTFEQVMAIPQKLTEKGRGKIVVAIDEFQQVCGYEGGNAEARLRSIIQHQKDVAYVFCGSRKHLISQMVLNQKRPFYKAGPHQSLKSISAEEWHPFIKDKFRSSAKSISSPVIDKLLNETGGHPYYTQQLCHEIWDITEVSSEAASSTVTLALNTLLDKENSLFVQIWDSLTKNQRDFLFAMALEPPGIKVFSEEILSKYHLKTASSAQGAARALLEMDLIEKTENGYSFVDLFFRRWIRLSDKA
jgi:AAA+ ATPase superfamily predicted ATPase